MEGYVCFTTPSAGPSKKLGSSFNWSQFEPSRGSDGQALAETPDTFGMNGNEESDRSCQESYPYMVLSQD